MSVHPGWLLVLLGLCVAAVGVIWLFAPHVPWLGRLPGDIVIERGNVRVYFPITTCILLSLILTAALWLARRFLQ